MAVGSGEQVGEVRSASQRPGAGMWGFAGEVSSAAAAAAAAKPHTGSSPGRAGQGSPKGRHHVTVHVNAITQDEEDQRTPGTQPELMGQAAASPLSAPGQASQRWATATLPSETKPVTSGGGTLNLVIASASPGVFHRQAALGLSSSSVKWENYTFMTELPFGRWISGATGPSCSAESKKHGC